MVAIAVERILDEPIAPVKFSAVSNEVLESILNSK